MNDLVKALLVGLLVWLVFRLAKGNGVSVGSVTGAPVLLYSFNGPEAGATVNNYNSYDFSAGAAARRSAGSGKTSVQ